jgi:hypothetical protein
LSDEERTWADSILGVEAHGTSSAASPAGAADPPTDVGGGGLRRAEAFDVGQLLASPGTSDVVDAYLVVCARRTGHVLVSGDPDDLRWLDGNVPLLVV